MDLTQRLRVPAPLDEVWAVVNDPARLAAVLPGTTLDSADGDTFTGTMKIKLGSSLLTLTGSGRYAHRDQGARRVVLTTSGADRRGDAAVEASHTLTVARAPGSTAESDVTVATTTTWTGRPGRLGDGVVADAVDRVLQQLTSRVAARVAEGLAWAPPAGGAHTPLSSAEAVVDHPVELGDDLGEVLGDGDTPGPDRRSAPPAPSPSPGPSPRPPRPGEAYVHRPFESTAGPPLGTARTLVRTVAGRVAPYAGLGALAVFTVVAAVRRRRVRRVRL